MTETIEQKALALVNEVAVDFRVPPWDSIDRRSFLEDVLCRAIEQHEAFKREVSDAVEKYLGHQSPWPDTSLRRFIIAKPDPLVEVMNAWWDADGYASIETFRAALAARGLEIVKKEPSND